ncbi:MAG: hypothetical protein RR588_01655 [Solibacillus sp.]
MKGSVPQRYLNFVVIKREIFHFFKREAIAIRKKKIWFLLTIVIAILLFVFYSKRIQLFNEVSGLDTANIESAQISYPKGMNWYEFNSKELEQLIAILGSLEVRKKLIPNIQAFNADSYIVIDKKETETTYTIKFDYKRNIIGIIEDRKHMDQYIVIKDSELFFFVQNLIKNNVKKIQIGDGQ